ncbi:hypothetical protein TIFTF001_040844 [Ficus carica]|uniref:Retrotransposon gag domain-containing protein n=1 Tax=Ficus carica TaxID=3494 RepID=A0AA87ZHD5_FICCA|nr:hypothetical protein TIFTF001_040844 [Ficus carica]
MAAPYPARFKMSTIAPYDGFTDADEHLENYQAHMLIQNANEATLCQAFCLTLTGTALLWYRRLIPRTMDSFRQLSDAFLAAFLNAKTRKKETSYLFRIKQDENEHLKGYLDCFDKVIIKVKNSSDDTLIQAFREGVGDKKLLWTIAYDVPPTFAHLMGITQKHAEAEEYIRRRNYSLGETLRLAGKKKPKKDGTNQIRADTKKATYKTKATPGPKTPVGRGLLRDRPPIRTDRARRNQNKYCNFHKEFGHETKECIQLCDQIELLVRDGHLREFVEKTITPTSTANRTSQVRPHTAPRTSDRTNVGELEHIVHTILGE